MDCLTIIVDPFSIACVMFIRKGFHGDYPLLLAFAFFESQLHFLVCLMYQQFLGTAAYSDKLPIDGYDSITNLDMDTRSSEWRSRLLVPGIALNNTSDAIA